MMVEDLLVTAGLPDDERAVAATFVLPKGGYATTLLGRAFRLLDATARPRAAGAPVDADPDPAEEGEADGSSG